MKGQRRNNGIETSNDDVEDFLFNHIEAKKSTKSNIAGCTHGSSRTEHRTSRIIAHQIIIDLNASMSNVRRKSSASERWA